MVQKANHTKALLITGILFPSVLLDLYQLPFEVSERKKRSKILKIELRFQLFKAYDKYLSQCYSHALKPSAACIFSLY